MQCNQRNFARLKLVYQGQRRYTVYNAVGNADRHVGQLHYHESIPVHLQAQLPKDAGPPRQSSVRARTTASGTYSVLRGGRGELRESGVHKRL